MRKVVTRYTMGGAANIAYQAIGQGPFDVVLLPGFPSNLEILSEDPGFVHLVRRLTTFCRLILFDPRGVGLSGGVDPGALPDTKARAGDILAVMDAAGSGRAALIGASDGAAPAILVAATQPSRCRSLVLCGGYGCFVPHVMEEKALQAHVRAIEADWGKGSGLLRMAPRRVEDRALAAWWGRLERLSASPTTAAALARMFGAVDVREFLSAVKAPTLVLHSIDDAQVPVEAGRRLARGIAGARFVELSGQDHAVWMGEVDNVADVIEQFLTGEKPVAQGDHVLAALLVTRVLGTADGLGRNVQGRHLLERQDLFHEALARMVARHGGKAQWTRSGRADARFGGVARAASCAVALRESATALGLAVAQGIHVAEIDLSSDDLSGQAFDLADRIAAAAGKSEILLTRLASQLVTGSGLQFVDHGALPDFGSAGPLPLVILTRERHLEPLNRTGGRTSTLGVLTQREREVLALVADGLSNPQIAVNLGLSEHTVKRHVANILLKLDMPNRAAVAGLAARERAP